LDRNKNPDYLKLFLLSNKTPAKASKGPPNNKYQPHLNLISDVRYLEGVKVLFISG
jgi:hypothetical protein